MSAVTSGIHPSVNLNKFASDEMKIIDKFKSEWYVTHGGEEIKLGSKSTYRYFLIKPVNNYQEMFNLEREIIVIFSPYAFFEPRTLDAIDYVTERYQSLRLEKVCSIIISRDEQIEDKLKELLKNDQESQILIPFNYKELLENHDPYFIRNRFKKHFYTRDLFAFEAPLRKDLYFFGRNDLVNKIVNRHKSCENSGLFGLRKTGKTSVIFGVQRTLQKMDEHFVFIDCQSPSFHLRRWNRALYYLILEISKQNKLNLKLNPEEKYTEEDAAFVFEHEIIRIHKELGNKTLLIIFDEIENITFNISPSRHWRKELDFVYFWQSLRSTFQKLDHVFSFLLVGTNPMCVESSSITGYDNPIFNQFSYEYIPGFDVKQTREMVRKLGRIMGIRFDEILYSKLTEEYGGHPFLIRHVCSIINQNSSQERPTEVNKLTYNAAKEIFKREHSNYIEMILHVLKTFYSDEYEMLKFLALDDFDNFAKYERISPTYTNHLLGYGIIDKWDEGYSFKIESVKDYLSGKHRYEKLELSQKEMLAEISERRNELEPKLRLIVRNQLLSNFGKVRASQIVLGIMGGWRKERYKDDSYNDLFDPSVSTIYINDLRKIMIKEWNVFKNIFEMDRAELDSKMTAINKYRSDAHAKLITKNQMAYFRASISSIEEITANFLT